MLPAYLAEAKADHAAALLDKKGVAAVGVGYKVVNGQRTSELAVTVGVQTKKPTSALSLSDQVPRLLPTAQGLAVPTDVVEVGHITAPPPFGAQAAHPLPSAAAPVQVRATLDQRFGRLRPAQPGCSIGHYKITAGTLGAVVNHKGQVMLLSNNHVLADSGAAHLHDAIYQPGPYDGGSAADRIGQLHSFMPILFDGASQAAAVSFGLVDWLRSLFGSKLEAQHRRPRRGQYKTGNYVDAALCLPDRLSDVIPEIIGIGLPHGTADHFLGQKLQKTGRTTGYTTGEVTMIDVTVQVDYGGPVATFERQFMAGAMSAGGDSGSLVLDLEGRAVGLLFAGSDTTTVFNAIGEVTAALYCSLITG